MSFLPTGFKRPTQFGGLMKGGVGTRALGMFPRLKSNAMMLQRFMPDSYDVAKNIECSKAGGTVFVPFCLSAGAPRGGLSLPTPGAGGLSFPTTGGFAAKPVKTHSIWGLYDAGMEPQMFVTISEHTATVGTTAVKFVDAEFAKGKPDAMALSVFKADPNKAIATTFPAEAGYAKFSWQLT